MARKISLSLTFMRSKLRCLPAYYGLGGDETSIHFLHDDGLAVFLFHNYCLYFFRCLFHNYYLCSWHGWRTVPWMRCRCHTAHGCKRQEQQTFFYIILLHVFFIRGFYVFLIRWWALFVLLLLLRPEEGDKVKCVRQKCRFLFYFC